MRILIIEDEFDLAKALAKGLKNNGYAADIALLGEEALQKIEFNEYDLAVLDLNLPDIDGLELCKTLRAWRPKLLILILTCRKRLKDKVMGLDMGADDYLAKPFHFQELLARIRALLRRDLPTKEPILQVGDLKLDPSSRTVFKGNRRLELRNKEFCILEYLMRRAGEVISQEELLEHAWGEEELDFFTANLRVHIHSLRKELNDDAQNPKYIETLPGVGYRLKRGEN
ncbi:MAG: response regulator transcription factor [Caldiserica bacterium]|jgi:DNA-binding response OmpR family regulator|nr:response regulator transcription factor [Caldisericota bacterium]